MLVRLSILTACMYLCGCQEADDRPPPLPPGEGGAGFNGLIGGGGGGNRDSGTAERDASVDGGDSLGEIFALNECLDDGELPALTNLTFMPADLMATRGFAHWTGNCGDPSLTIGLSDGECPDGDGHELIIEIDSDAITESTLFIPGGNQLMEERPDVPIRVRYRRPSDLTPSGTWGTCAGVTGELILEALDVRRRSALRGEFVFTLAACDGATTTPTFSITGTFDMDLERGLAEVCL